MKTINKQIKRQIQYLIAMAFLATMMTSCGTFGTEFLSVLSQNMGGYGQKQTYGNSLFGWSQSYSQPSTRRTQGVSTASYGNIASASKSQSVGQNDDSKSEKTNVDTSRIDRQIQDLEESLRDTEMREAKEHSLTRSHAIQELKRNINDLKKYRQKMLSGR